MRLRRLFALTGAVWGLLAGLVLAFQLFGLAAGVFWLFLFGDDPWPESAVGYLLAIPLMGGLAAVAAVAGLGYVYGRRREGAARPEAARRQGRRLLVAGLGVWLLAGAGAAFLGERQQTARDLSAAREAAFARLRDARRVVTGVAAGVDPGRDREGLIRLQVETAGARDGGYRLVWRLEEPLYRVVLAQGERRVSLSPEASAIDLDLDRGAVARRYREEILSHAGSPVLIDQDFRLLLTLEPLLEAGERAGLPPREIGNLARGVSDLRFESRAEVAMRFEIPAGSRP